LFVVQFNADHILFHKSIATFEFLSSDVESFTQQKCRLVLLDWVLPVR